MVQMDPALKQWLRDEVYPKLSHDQIFAMLPGYTKAEFSETRYADCPRCHHDEERIAGAVLRKPGERLGPLLPLLGVVHQPR